MFASLILSLALLGQVPGRTICVPDRKPVEATVVQEPAVEFVGPNLPCFTKNLSDNDFKWWVIRLNEIAAESAAAQADMGTGMVVIDTFTYGQSSGRVRGFNNLHTRQFQTVAPGAAPYGGGPLWIHNPYVRH